MKALNRLLQRVAATIERHAMFAPGQRIGVAVSGGADSVCLLHVLRDLAHRQKWTLTILHLDHQLRGSESSADADFVRGLAAALCLPVISRCANLPPAGNLEQEARRARLAFFRQAIDAGTVDRVAVGHTRSDQAETVLFRLMRGAGAAGLAGIRPVTLEGIARPLLDIDRIDVESFLRDRGIPWREDSTNAGRQFARNRIRHELLPQLARDWNPEIAGTLARTADWALAEEAYWRDEIDRLESGRLRQEDGAVLLSAKSLTELPLAVARRLVRRAIERAKGDLRGIDFGPIDAVLHLARNEGGSGRVQAHGLDICRSFEWVRFAVPAEVGAYQVLAPVPGIVEIPRTSGAVSLELLEKSETFSSDECVYNGEMGCVDWGRVSGSLELRSWIPGDRYQPVGCSRVKKFKTLFQLARIPFWERSQWPVLVAGTSVVWTRRFGPAVDFAAGPQTRTVLRIRELKLHEGNRNLDD